MSVYVHVCAHVYSEHVYHMRVGVYVHQHCTCTCPCVRVCVHIMYVYGDSYVSTFVYMYVSVFFCTDGCVWGYV